MWRDNSWILHHDNCPPSRALLTRAFLAKTNPTVLEHAAYSPDLAPNDFFLYPKSKEVMKGAHFADAEVMKQACETVLKEIPEDAFQECFQAWKRRMEKCVRAQGEYIEGCHM